MENEEGHSWRGSFVHEYDGLWEPGAKCNIHILIAPDRIPLIICSERSDNDNTSVTNLAEAIAGEIANLFFRHNRNDCSVPFLWIERYYGNRAREETFSLVLFTHYQPTSLYLGRGWRVAIGRPYWIHLNADSVSELVASYNFGTLVELDNVFAIAAEKSS